MCGNCKEGKCGKKCISIIIAKWLIIIGGINWGLVGVGMLLNSNVDSWNLVHIILGRMSAIEAIVYVLVGVAAVMKIFGCKCCKCKNGVCDTSKAETKAPEEAVK